MGGDQNPLFDSTTGQQIPTERGQRNVLFGSDILDSLDTRCGSHHFSAAEELILHANTALGEVDV